LYALGDVYNSTLLFCQDSNENLQGNIKVQGMGVFFLVMPLAQTRLPDGGQAWHAKHQYKELTYEIL